VWDGKFVEQPGDAVADEIGGQVDFSEESAADGHGLAYGVFVFAEVGVPAPAGRRIAPVQTCEDCSVLGFKVLED